jgi:hypothetical protein
MKRDLHPNPMLFPHQPLLPGAGLLLGSENSKTAAGIYGKTLSANDFCLSDTWYIPQGDCVSSVQSTILQFSRGRHGLPREEERAACFADGTQPATEAATHTRTWRHRDIAPAYRRPPDIAHTCRSAHSAPYRPKSFGELKQ